jgi:hypothetical protein
LNAFYISKMIDRKENKPSILLLIEEWSVQLMTTSAEARTLAGEDVQYFLVIRECLGSNAFVTRQFLPIFLKCAKK